METARSRNEHHCVQYFTRQAILPLVTIGLVGPWGRRYAGDPTLWQDLTRPFSPSLSLSLSLSLARSLARSLAPSRTRQHFPECLPSCHLNPPHGPLSSHPNSTPPCAMARHALPSCILPLLLLLLLCSTYASAHGGGHGDDDDDADAGGGGDAGSPPPNLRRKSLILVKIWCLILVFAGTFVGGISPYFFNWNEAFLALGTQFAGGVFFGTALMHFLSDAAETFEDLTKKEYPFAFMLAGAGYLLTMLADCVISAVVGRPRDRGGDVEGVDADRGSSQKDSTNRVHSRTHDEAQERKLDHINSIASSTSLGDSILLIVALCFHSVFEGIAIGVAKNQADAWRALWTVSLHKVFAAIAMGITLLRMIPDRPFVSCVAYAFAFAISSPVGVAIGIVIDATTQGHVADWIYAISMGIACGVFIFVSINHLLAKGYKSERPLPTDTPFNRWLAAVLGVGVIAVVMIWD